MVDERRALLSLHLHFVVQYKFFVIIIIIFTTVIIIILNIMSSDWSCTKRSANLGVYNDHDDEREIESADCREDSICEVLTDDTSISGRDVTLSWT